MKQAKDLEFSPIGENAPPFHCNNCGGPVKSHKGLISENIPVAQDGEANIIVCSQKCADDFKKNPHADAYITDLVERSKKMNE